MKIKSILASLVLLLGMVNVANAVSVSMVPASVEAAPGDLVALDVLWDFTDDPTLGGGFDIAYDPTILNFVSWTPNVANPPFDPAFSREPDVSPGLLSGIAGGNFAGISGPVVRGTVTFTVIGAVGDVTNVTPGDTNSVAGPFVSLAGAVQTVDYTHAEITVIPLPAAAWLFGSALFGLVAVKRKKA